MNGIRHVASALVEGLIKTMTAVKRHSGSLAPMFGMRRQLLAAKISRSKRTITKWTVIVICSYHREASGWSVLPGASVKGGKPCHYCVRQMNIKRKLKTLSSGCPNCRITGGNGAATNEASAWLNSVITLIVDWRSEKL